MVDQLPMFLFAGFCVLVLAMMIVGGFLEGRRVKRLRELADQLGLAFQPQPSDALLEKLSFLNDLTVGRSRKARYLLTGQWDGQTVSAFEYTYQIGSGKSRHTVQISVFIVPLARSFPELTIRPESFLSKVAQAVGYEDIDFESAEFSRRFCVRSADKQFAYDVCNPQAIEFLLRQRDVDVEIEGMVLAAFRREPLAPDRIMEMLRLLIDFRALLPAYLFEKDRP